MKLFGNDNESTLQFQTDFFQLSFDDKAYILVDDVLGTFRAVRSDAKSGNLLNRLDFPYALSTLSLRATFPPIA